MKSSNAPPDRSLSAGGGRLSLTWKVLAVLTMLLALLVLLWNWNWLRPLIAREASVATGRPVTLGRFNVRLSRHPALEFDDVAVADPASLHTDKSLLTVRKLTLRIDPLALWHGTLNLVSVDIDQPRIDLHTARHGKRNWSFPDGEPGAGLRLKIGALSIHDGTLHLYDRALKADFNANFRTQPAADGSEPQFVADAKGRYAGQPIRAHFVGGAVLSLRDASHPYPVDFTAINGDTRIQLTGTVLRPLEWGGAQLTLTLRGDSLADLYPLTAIPLPPTPAYHLDGNLDYADHKIRFRDFDGVVGSSDLSGAIEVDPRQGRPMITGDLISDKVVLTDLAGFIGAAPEASTKQTPKSPAGSPHPRVLPDQPLNLPKLRSADLDIHYAGKRIVSSSMPLDDLTAHLIATDGKLRLDPLSFGVGNGSIVGHIVLDANTDPLRTQADIDFRHISLRNLLNGDPLAKDTGIIGGRLDIDTSGNSVAQMLGNGDGGLKLFMGGGKLRALLVDLVGMDAGKTVLSDLNVPKRARFRCMIADLGLEHGVMNTRTMLIDTDQANIVGTGSADFSSETLHYRVTSDPKHFSIGSPSALIKIGGTFQNPSIAPDSSITGLSTPATTTLGAILAPVAALIPTVKMGLGENHDCKRLLKAAQKARAEGPNAVIKPLQRPEPD